MGTGVGLFYKEPEKATYRNWYNWYDIPSGPCHVCKEKEGEVWYSDYPVDYNRGGADKAWCRECIIKDLDKKIENLIKFRERLNNGLL